MKECEGARGRGVSREEEEKGIARTLWHLFRRDHGHVEDLGCLEHLLCCDNDRGVRMDDEPKPFLLLTRKEAGSACRVSASARYGVGRRRGTYDVAAEEGGL